MIIMNQQIRRKKNNISLSGKFSGIKKKIKKSVLQKAVAILRILDIQAILPDQVLIRNFILYFVRYSYLHFRFIYQFIHLRYFSINRLFFLCLFYTPNFGKVGRAYFLWFVCLCVDVCVLGCVFVG